MIRESDRVLPDLDLKFCREVRKAVLRSELLNLFPNPAYPVLEIYASRMVTVSDGSSTSIALEIEPFESSSSRRTAFA
jgi:hypothetical protein